MAAFKIRALAKDVPKPVPVVASLEDRRQARKASAALALAFSWRETAEGEEFWSDVQARLDQIEKDGILK